MFNFFAKEAPDADNTFCIAGSDYNHIANVLRMKEGDEILVSFEGVSRLCVLAEFTNEYCLAKIADREIRNTELPVKLHLFQGLPKSDKLELIIQKCTELGVSEITPTEMNRCVVKLEEKKKKNKVERWQAICESAAKQSKRSIIPTVNQPIPFKNALQKASELDLVLVPYESKNGMQDTKKALSLIKPGMSIGIIIGPEGGFDEKEIELAKNNGGQIISLGKRILRTETAAITAVAMCMLYAENEFEVT